MQSELEKAQADKWFGLIPLALGGLLVTMALLIGVVGSKIMDHSQALLVWPETEGTVTSSLYSSYREPGESIDTYSYAVSVSYVVNGQTYEYHHNGRVGEVEAKKNELRYAIGQKVPVFYDPAKPSMSSLTRDEPAPTSIPLGIAAVCLVLSVPFLFFGVRSLINARKRIAELGAEPVQR